MVRVIAKSKYLGLLLGIMLGAGSAFAATTVYNYTTTVQATATVVQGQVITAPGLEVVGNSSIDFGEVEQGGTSNEVTIQVKNVGNQPLKFINVMGSNLPAGLSLIGTGKYYDTTVVGGWGMGVIDSQDIDPGESVSVKLQLKATEDLTPGSYQFEIEIRGE